MSDDPDRGDGSPVPAVTPGPASATPASAPCVSNEEAEFAGSAHALDDSQSFSFPTFMERVRKALGPGVFRVDLLTEAQRRFDILLAEVSAGQPLPGHFARMVAQVRDSLDYIDAASRGLVSVPSGTPLPLFDPIVIGLLTLNYWHVVKETTREQADAALAAIVVNLTRHSAKGRPPKISVSQVIEIRRLRMEERLAYGQIAQQLGLSSARGARTAHKHHYPDDFAEKNSR
jgi:hypothetical protein